MTKEDAMDYLARCADGSDPDFDAAVVLSVSALRAQAEEEKNEPLTLDELRKMSGEPVWVRDNTGTEAWGLVTVFGKDPDAVEVAVNRILMWPGWCYGMDGPAGWLAYRHKPEEGMT